MEDNPLRNFNLFDMWDGKRPVMSADSGMTRVTGNELMDNFLQDIKFRTIVSLGVSFLCFTVACLLLTLLYRLYCQPRMELYEEVAQAPPVHRRSIVRSSGPPSANQSTHHNINQLIMSTNGVNNVNSNSSNDRSSHTREGSGEYRGEAAGDGAAKKDAIDFSKFKFGAADTGGTTTTNTTTTVAVPMPMFGTKKNDDDDGDHDASDADEELLRTPSLSNSTFDSNSSNNEYYPCDVAAAAQAAARKKKVMRGMPTVIEKNQWRTTFKRLVSDTKNSARNMEAIHALLTVPFSMRLHNPMVNTELASDPPRRVRAIIRRNRLHQFIPTLFEANVVEECDPESPAVSQCFFCPVRDGGATPMSASPAGSPGNNVRNSGHAPDKDDAELSMQPGSGSGGVGGGGAFLPVTKQQTTSYVEKPLQFAASPVASPGRNRVVVPSSNRSPGAEENACAADALQLASSGRHSATAGSGFHIPPQWTFLSSASTPHVARHAELEPPKPEEEFGSYDVRRATAAVREVAARNGWNSNNSTHNRSGSPSMSFVAVATPQVLAARRRRRMRRPSQRPQTDKTPVAANSSVTTNNSTGVPKVLSLTPPPGGDNDNKNTNANKSREGGGGSAEPLPPFLQNSSASDMNSSPEEKKKTQ